MSTNTNNNSEGPKTKKRTTTKEQRGAAAAVAVFSEAKKRDIEECIRTLSMESLRREKQDGIEFPVLVTPLVLQRLGYTGTNGERDIRANYVKNVEYKVGFPPVPP
jgi:hypothetical protein